MSKTIPQLNAMLSEMGSDVTYHREEAGVPCPCRTPEGFRDRAWHRMIDEKIIDISNQTLAVSDVEPGTIEGGHDIVWSLAFLSSVGIGPTFFPIGNAYPVQEVDPTWNPPGGWNPIFTNITVPAPPIPGIQAVLLLRQVDNGPIMRIAAFIANTDYTDIEPISFSNPVAPWSVECNEEGFLGSTITSKVVKASIQPATIGQRGRAAERANALLGEIQRDDHFGIFPVTWGGVTLDFSAFSDSGDDYIVYDGRRFLVVAADKIPDVDGDANHHWEVGLRLIKSTRPS